MRFSFLLSFCILFVLTACSSVSTPTEGNRSIPLKSDSLLYQQLQAAHQLIEELDLILIELQKTDEYPEAIEMMDTAKREAALIIENLQSIRAENSNLAQLKSLSVDILQQYGNGLEKQIEGMETWDGKKTTEGFKQTEMAKTEFKTLLEQINGLSP